MTSKWKLGGAPKIVTPDNTKTGVTKACRYDPDLNPTYRDFALHYGMGVVPARPRRPRDKAKVECGVQVAEHWILAALRHRKFFNIADANAAIRDLLARLNRRPFRKQPGSRASLFEEAERAALRPLPAERFDLSQWSRARVNIHQAHLEWTPSRMVSWASTIGPHTAQLFDRILGDKPHPEMGYRGCLGIIRLAKQYSAQSVEALPSELWPPGRAATRA
ncbi:MAG: hypothetical protein JSU00_31705 [Acidobacteria bacterium]|nr:hypothetical protein [Acidobacteriota bacterium]